MFDKSKIKLFIAREVEYEKFLKDFLSRPRKKYTPEQLEAAKKVWEERQIEKTEFDIEYGKYLEWKYTSKKWN